MFKHIKLGPLLSSVLLTATLQISIQGEALAGVRHSATYYSNYFVGRRMANGRPYSHNKMVAAHPRYKLGTRLRVRYKNRSVIVTVTDRCRCSIDLSKRAFRQLAPLSKGRVPVVVSKL